MRAVAVILTILLCFNLTEASLLENYQKFKVYAKEYNKRYESKSVELFRFAIYLKNLAEIAILNADPEDNAIYG